MALQFRPPIAPKPVPRTGSVPIPEHSDDLETLYDDIIHATQSTCKVPPPVASRPKQLLPSVTEQKNTNNITKESTTKLSQKVPPLVATRSKQNMSPVTKQRNSPSSNDMISIEGVAIKKFLPPVSPYKPKQHVSSLTEQGNSPSSNDMISTEGVAIKKVLPPVSPYKPKQHVLSLTEQRNSPLSNDMISTEGVAMKHLLKVPPPVSPKPKQHISSLTEQGNSPLYDNIASTMTKSLQKVPPQAVARLTQHTRSPVTEQCNVNSALYDDNTVSPKQVAALSVESNTDEDDVPLYDDAISVKQDMRTLTPKFVPQLTPPVTVHSDMHAPIAIASSVTLPRAVQRSSHHGITSSKKYMNIAIPESCKMAALMSLTFPRLVQISSGCCGNKNYPISSLSKGEELLIFFTKRATVVPAYKPGKNAEIYHIPMCSTFQFGLISDQPNEEAVNYNFDSITDILSQTRELPKAIKVLKSYVGKTEESSVSGGTLIFPKRVITHTDKKGKEKMQLVCINNSNDKTLTLKLPCIGNFSTHPSDVKMSILQYISYVNVFPVAVQVFNYNKILRESYINPGTKFVLNDPTKVNSYICTKDIFRENDYPLLEVPVEVPVTVQCKEEHDGVNMMSVHDAAKVLYDNFSLSKIKNYVPFCEESSYEIQDELYKEITLDISSGTKEYYELASPVDEHNYEYVDIETEQYKATNLSSPILSPQLLPKKSCFSSPHSNTLPIMAKQISKDHPLRIIQPQKKTLSMPRQPQTAEEKNKAYLQSLSREDVLQLLDNMNLSQHKASFQEEQVDGMILAVLTSDDLKELGVTKGVQIKRLLRLINGIVSAKDILEYDEHDYI